MLGERHRSPSLTIHHLPASARSQHDEHSTTHTAMSDMITIIIQITMATMNSYITLYNPAYAMSVLCSFLGCFSQRNRGFDSCSHRVAHASQHIPPPATGIWRPLCRHLGVLQVQASLVGGFNPSQQMLGIIVLIDLLRVYPRNSETL